MPERVRFISHLPAVVAAASTDAYNKTNVKRYTKTKCIAYAESIYIIYVCCTLYIVHIGRRYSVVAGIPRTCLFFSVNITQAFVRIRAIFSSDDWDTLRILLEYVLLY